MNSPELSRQIAFDLFDFANDNLATEEERRLERALNVLECVRKIGISDLRRLKSAFEAASSNDPYYLSPTYYALTGRRGLWLHRNRDAEGNKTVFLFCLHPNLQDTLVIFPPFGHNPTEAVVDFIKQIHNTGLNIDIQVGRVPHDFPTDALSQQAHNITVTPKKEEDVLDWRYPVHTVDCKKLIDREGPDFARIRQTMNKYQDSATTRLIDFERDYPTIAALAAEWESRTKHYEKYELTTGYFHYLHLLANNQPSLKLKGLIISVDGVDKGFSIWEPALNKGNTANLFASQVSDFKLTNLATFLTVASAKQILEDGSQFVCLGGSETPGMDRYKRGFIPDISTELQTLEISMEQNPKLVPVPTIE